MWHAEECIYDVTGFTFIPSTKICKLEYGPKYSNYGLVFLQFLFLPFWILKTYTYMYVLPCAWLWLNLRTFRRIITRENYLSTLPDRTQLKGK